MKRGFGIDEIMINDVAAMLRVSRMTVKRWIKKGELKAERVWDGGVRWAIKVREVEKIFEREK